MQHTTIAVALGGKVALFMKLCPPAWGEARLRSGITAVSSFLTYEEGNWKPGSATDLLGGAHRH
jgi:hypothetical protein